jgi:hypothetical protein
MRIGDRQMMLILAVVVGVSMVGLVLGYNTGNPSVMGHSWGEMKCDDTLCVNSVNGNVGIGTASPTKKLTVNGNIDLAGNIVKTGTVANVVMVQTREQGTYSAPVSGYGTEITPLRLSITPKKAGNRIILEWVVNGEMIYDTVYIVTRNGVPLAGTTDSSNNRWAGITAQPYDGNSGSTPDNTVVKIIDMNSLDVATTYELRVRSSGGTAYTLYLNRAVSSAGQDTYETSLSTGIATEIWQ